MEDRDFIEIEKMILDGMEKDLRYYKRVTWIMIFVTALFLGVAIGFIYIGKYINAICELIPISVMIFSAIRSRKSDNEFEKFIKSQKKRIEDYENSMYN